MTIQSRSSDIVGFKAPSKIARVVFEPSHKLGKEIMKISMGSSMAEHALRLTSTAGLKITGLRAERQEQVRELNRVMLSQSQMPFWLGNTFDVESTYSQDTEQIMARVLHLSVMLPDELNEELREIMRKKGTSQGPTIAVHVPLSVDAASDERIKQFADNTGISTTVDGNATKLVRQVEAPQLFVRNPHVTLD